MTRTGVRSWTLVVAGSLFFGAMLTGCGGGGSSASDSQASTGTSPGTAALDPAASGAPNQGGTAGDAQGGIAQGGPGTVTLNWLPPTEYSDGTPLTGLAGYTIYYGTASQSYSQSIKVSNPGLTTYVVDNLPAGTYYFAIAAYDASGAQGSFSSEVAAAVN